MRVVEHAGALRAEQHLRRRATAAGTHDDEICLLLAARRGIPYVVINRGVTDHGDLSAVTLRLEGDVVEIFPPAVDRALSATS